ncbi:hypothetical protein Thal_0481 [Thermocrinis albus DSM 14484]|uniref:Uncharacterized protein n=1 Tax=Thermocrinis albus (strain DSM 14484 / JCM 11386 / HI 11/12) TaxID=638303 RepID=D3SPM8_THEAH|nr:hypothetical protein [Thermocrinis albus]ADC89115.1 hypothetical protein Thal_0481 [Thermocrinis albus DSM 14484]
MELLYRIGKRSRKLLLLSSPIRIVFFGGILFLLPSKDVLDTLTVVLGFALGHGLWVFHRGARDGNSVETP